MLRSPLQLLISLHRFLLRSKTRHRSSHVLFRPISKTASWSAGIISKIPTTTSPIILTKYIPALGHQHEQVNQLLRILQQRSNSTTRRLFPYRRTQGNGGSVYIQRRTMVSSGSGSNSGSQIASVLNATHFFTTPRPPILCVQGTPLLPPPPPASFRPYYSTKSPWNLRQQQQYFITPYSANSDIDDAANVADDDDNISSHFDINTRLHRVNYQHQHPTTTVATTTTASTASSSIVDEENTDPKQHTSYRPPNIRGMADLMDINDSDSNSRNKNHTTNINVMQSGNSKVYHPGLVHRGQPPRRSSYQQNPQQQKQQQKLQIPGDTQKGMSISPVNVLRHDDLSLQTTKKRMAPSTAIDSDTPAAIHHLHRQQQQQWYLSIPMDLTTSSSHNASATIDAPTTPNASALERLIFTENAVSILDPAWLTSFDSWEKRIREHLSKVMVLIQLVGMEAQRYTTTMSATATMDFKMIMKKSDTCTELHIYLPHELFAPLPTTRNKIQRWVDQLMKERPRFEIKCFTSTTNNTPTMAMEDTTMASSSATGRYVDTMDTMTGLQMGNDNNNNNKYDYDDDDDDLVMVPSRMTEMLAYDSHQHDDDSSSHIGPHYFQDIHTFLNHVDSMIESSPAFTSTGSHRQSL